MNKRFIFGLFCCAATFCFSQKLSTRVTIQESLNRYPEKNYSFYTVVDQRPWQQNIGVVYKDDRATPYGAVLKYPLDLELYRFLKNEYPNTMAGTRLLLVVHQFEIGQVLAKKDTGFVTVNFDFYRLRNDSVAFISNYTNTLAEATNNVSFSHASRMRRILVSATADMESHLSSPQSAAYVPVSTLGINLQQSSAQNKMAAAARTKDSLVKNAYPQDVMLLLGGHLNLCSSTLMPGANLSLLIRCGNSRVLLGPTANYSFIKFYDGANVLPSNVQSYKIRTADFGLRMLSQMKGFFFFNFNPHMFIGKETFENVHYVPVSTQSSSYVLTQYSAQTNETTHRLLGIEFDQGVYIMPPQHVGLFLGLDLVIRFTNSDVFDSDFGVKVSAGFKF